jgi:transposase
LLCPATESIIPLAENKQRISDCDVWAYRCRPCIGASLKARQKIASLEVKDIAWKAQHRLHRRYFKLMAKGKIMPKVVTAVAGEILVGSYAKGPAAELAILV